MTSTYEFPSYPLIQETLSELGTILSAAEAHGMLTGLACGNAETDVQAWINAILDDETVSVQALPQEAAAALQHLSTATHAVLNGADEAMQLLLPDDQQAITERTQALGEWCQGFIAGLGLSGCFINSESNQDSSEALQDLAEISQISTSIQGTEEEQKAFVEIVLYVQLAVLLIYRSLQLESDEQHLQPLTDTLH